jgi:hypothetical protein
MQVEDDTRHWIEGVGVVVIQTEGLCHFALAITMHCTSDCRIAERVVCPIPCGARQPVGLDNIAGTYPTPEHKREHWCVVWVGEGAKPNIPRCIHRRVPDDLGGISQIVKKRPHTSAEMLGPLGDIQSVC